MIKYTANAFLATKNFPLRTKSHSICKRVGDSLGMSCAARGRSTHRDRVSGSRYALREDMFSQGSGRRSRGRRHDDRAPGAKQEPLGQGMNPCFLWDNAITCSATRPTLPKSGVEARSKLFVRLIWRYLEREIAQATVLGSLRVPARTFPVCRKSSSES